MDILISIIFIILFLVVMIFVAGIGLVKPFMPKKEILLVFVAAFVIGSIAGAFFLVPVYNDMPEIISAVDKYIPTNEEVVELDVSYTTNPDSLMSDILAQDGVKSVKVTGVTMYTSKLTSTEAATIEHALSVLDSSYDSYNVNKSGKIDITLKENASVSKALQSFSTWYEVVYSGKVGSALVHYEVVISSSDLDDFKSYLLTKQIVPVKVTGPTKDISDHISQHMLPEPIFIVCCGIVGVIFSLIGVYYERVAVNYRNFKRNRKRNKRRKR